MAEIHVRKVAISRFHTCKFPEKENAQIDLFEGVYLSNRKSHPGLMQSHLQTLVLSLSMPGVKWMTLSSTEIQVHKVAVSRNPNPNLNLNPGE